MYIVGFKYYWGVLYDNSALGHHIIILFLFKYMDLALYICIHMYIITTCNGWMITVPLYATMYMHEGNYATMQHVIIYIMWVKCIGMETLCFPFPQLDIFSSKIVPLKQKVNVYFLWQAKLKV